MIQAVKLFQIFLIGLFFLVPLQNASAQDIPVVQDTLPAVAKNIMPEASVFPDVRMHPTTHPEKIVFTQLKLAKGRPDLDSFSKASPIVAKASDIDKPVLIISEYNRLQNAYSLHDQTKEIVVHTSLDTDQYSALQDLIVFDELNDSTFFQYSLYGYNVGIVPEDIQNFSNLQLSKPRAETLFQNVRGNGKLHAEFVLKPVYADIQTPFTLAEVDYWLMFARIAEFRLWSDRNPSDAKLLWFYRAPWFQRKDDANINSLYEAGS